MIIKWILTVVSIILIAAGIGLFLLGKAVIDFCGGWMDFVSMALGISMLIFAWTKDN
jgi:hypothetical protein